MTKSKTEIAMDAAFAAMGATVRWEEKHGGDQEMIRRICRALDLAGEDEAARVLYRSANARLGIRFPV